MSFEFESTGSARGRLDQLRLDPECPECGATVRMTVGEARRSPTRRCPNGHEISFEASDFERKIRGAEDQLDDLFG